MLNRAFARQPFSVVDADGPSAQITLPKNGAAPRPKRATYC